ncbi:hypothetical protein TgHK011_000746 [Trichoderma gracile]|nr:hypothetical protein TgHK011_000746 [Trichoderma gracile]
MLAFDETHTPNEALGVLKNPRGNGAGSERHRLLSTEAAPRERDDALPFVRWHAYDSSREAMLHANDVSTHQGVPRTSDCRCCCGIGFNAFNGRRHMAWWISQLPHGAMLFCIAALGVGLPCPSDLPSPT